MGRSDDMFKFRGVNIYPSSIDTILSQIPGLGSEYQVHLSRDDKSGRDSMVIWVEREKDTSEERNAAISTEIIEQCKKRLLVTVNVSIVEYGALPRSEKKSQRIFDSRGLNESVI